MTQPAIKSGVVTAGKHVVVNFECASIAAAGELFKGLSKALADGRLHLDTRTGAVMVGGSAQGDEAA